MKKPPQFDKTKFDKKKMRRSDGKKKSKMYWTDEHEAAVIEYATATQERRNELYNSLLGTALDEMIDNIVYTYKFTYLPNITSLKEECKHDLIKILCKYDPKRGSKSFAYFSVITKNNFIHLVKKNSKNSREELILDECLSSTEFHYKNLTADHEYESTRNEYEKSEFLKTEIQWWDVRDLCEEEKLVYQAFLQIYENIDKLEVVNTKAIRLYLKEMTGLKSKYITSALLKMKSLYTETKEEWLNED